MQICLSLKLKKTQEWVGGYPQTTPIKVTVDRVLCHLAARSGGYRRLQEALIRLEMKARDATCLVRLVDSSDRLL